MQTFLPVKSFVSSLEFLDSARLGKQRIEATQILEILLDKPILPQSLQTIQPFDRSYSGWVRHPAVQMWNGHEEWLKLYLACAIGEWRHRGYNNAIICPEYNTDFQDAPSWLGYEEFHRSHRSNLIRKAPRVFRQFWPDENDSLPYFWPTKNGF